MLFAKSKINSGPFYHHWRLLSYRISTTFTSLPRADLLVQFFSLITSFLFSVLHANISPQDCKENQYLNCIFLYTNTKLFQVFFRNFTIFGNNCLYKRKWIFSETCSFPTIYIKFLIENADMALKEKLK